MPRFSYSALSENGELYEGEMEAPTQAAVIERLQEVGHLPVRAQPLHGGARRPFKLPLPAGRGAVSRKQLGILTRELATMLHAGLPLDTALNSLVNLAATGPLRQVLERIQTAVQGGASLSSALEEHERVFDRFYVNMVRAGEAAGALDVVIDRLADYQEKSQELRESVVSALIYPVILVLVASVSLILLLMLVVPNFTPLFEDMGQALPVSTRIVIAAAEILRDYWWLLLLLGAALVYGLRTQLADPASRYRWDAAFLKLPLFGDLITKIEVARFSRTLGTLLANGVPVLTGIGIVRETLKNQVLAEAVDGVAASLEQGHGLASPLADSGRFPDLAVQLVKVGEDTGKLEAMLLKLADVYDAEVRTAVKRLLTLLEPVLILGMGVMIAAIIISILLALLGLNELVA